MLLKTEEMVIATSGEASVLYLDYDYAHLNVGMFHSGEPANSPIW